MRVMAYRTHIDEDLNCVFVQHFGTYEEGEEAEQLNELAETSAYKENMNLIRDITQISLPETYDLEWFRRTVKKSMALTNDALGSGRKVAWVLGNSQDFIKVHQWCGFAKQDIRVVERRPFRDVNSAKKWLRVPEEYVVPYPD